jgi:hypothetical protein
MQVAFITPIPMLEEFAGASKYHLILAHVCEQSPEYTAFYKQRAAAGDYVILDNGAYELGESVQLDLLKKYAEIIKPSVVVLPDVRGDAGRTLERTVEGISALRGGPWTLMGVPQAPLHEPGTYLWCLQQMYQLEGIGAIGIYPETEAFSTEGRAGLAKSMEILGLVREDLTYHMLGMNPNPITLKELAKFPWIMGCDSVKPIAYGLYGVALHPRNGSMVEYPHRPKNYFNICDTPFKALIRWNQQVILSWAEGKETVGGDLVCLVDRPGTKGSWNGLGVESVPCARRKE